MRLLFALTMNLVYTEVKVKLSEVRYNSVVDKSLMGLHCF